MDTVFLPSAFSATDDASVEKDEGEEDTIGGEELSVVSDVCDGRSIFVAEEVFIKSAEETNDTSF